MWRIAGSGKLAPLIPNMGQCADIAIFSQGPAWTWAKKLYNIFVSHHSFALLGDWTQVYKKP